jgi:hypothetical protein
MSATLLYDGLNSALLDAISVGGQNFLWNGQPYGCIVNAEQNSLVTAKSLFNAGTYPDAGAVITVANIKRQVTEVANDAPEFIAGGKSSTSTFVDDPANPALHIVFDSFLGT